MQHEDKIGKPFNFPAYDAWEFGATIYTLLMNRSPYGYECWNGGARVYNEEEAEREMFKVRKLHVHMYPELDFPVNGLSHKEKKMVRRLIIYTTELMQLEPSKRLTPNSNDFTL
jgi:hypothetical protein